MPISFLERVDRLPRGSLRFVQTSLFKKNASARFIYSRDRSNVSEAFEYASCIVEVVQSFLTAIDLEVEKAEIVLDVGQVSPVLDFFEVITGRGIFNQSAVEIIAALLLFPETFQHVSESGVITPP